MLVEAFTAELEPLEFRRKRKVENEIRVNVVVHDPDALLNIIDQQQRDQAVIEANDAARRQTAKRRDARSVAAARTKLQANAADKHDESQSAKTAGVKAERNVGTKTTSVSFVASKVTRNGTVPKVSRARRGKAFMARATARSQSSSTSNPQAVPLSTPRAKPPGRSLRMLPYGWS